MNWNGEKLNILRKMKVSHATPCEYYLLLGDKSLRMNDWIGHQIEMRYTGRIYCTQCGRKTTKSFQQGHCFPCFKRLQECGCMVKPEQCKFYQGQCSPDDWAHAHCGQAHVVYLANSSGLKVGITRNTNVPSRWIDQGASQALPFISVSNRYQAGLVEVLCKNYVADKTNWRAMLKGPAKPLDLIAERDDLLNKISAQLTNLQAQYPGEIELIQATPFEFDYPVRQYPDKIHTYNLDKHAEFSDRLQGIKGQYLLLEQGVINVRKFSGYEIEFMV